jgi:hypothetical protein
MGKSPIYGLGFVDLNFLMEWPRGELKDNVGHTLYYTFVPVVGNNQES